MRKAVILAAGIGSRLGGNLPKSLVDLGGTNSMKHILSSLKQCEVDEVVIVIGYESNQIIDAMGYEYSDMKIIYVYNEFYNYHGCGYSLSMAYNQLEDADELLIVEADLLMPLEYFKAIIEDENENTILLRSSKKINPFKSVVAVGNSNLVNRFVYDREHNDVYKLINDNEIIIGESMQIWKFSGDACKGLVSCLKDYKENISKGPDLSNGIISINLVLKKYTMSPLFVDGDKWININTIEDVKKGSEAHWLRK